MSKLEKVFDTPNKKAFIGFLTAGDPDSDSTVKFILEMEKAWGGSHRDRYSLF